jgi:cell division cycle 2-like protein
VFGELITRSAILTGDVEADQLRLIFELTGRPDAALTEKFQQLPDWDKCATAAPLPLCDSFSSKFRGLDPAVLNLLKAMLHLDPASRISAANALDDSYFSPSDSLISPSE